MTPRAQHWLDGLDWECVLQSALEADRLAWVSELATYLARLPTAQKSVVRLVYIDGMTTAEVAARLQLGTSEIRRLLSAGLRELGAIVYDGNTTGASAAYGRHRRPNI